MRTASKLIMMTATLALLSACASAPKVRVDQDANTNFAAYKTFGWFVMEKKEGAQPLDSLQSQRVRAAVLSAMQAKGYELDEANPNFKISYVLHVYERPKESGMRIGVGAGGGSGNVGGGVGLSVPVGKRNESVAALTLDIVDAARNAQVWTAAYELPLKDKDLSDAEAKKLVDTVLAKYPVRTP
jgi:hypothetical protein